MGTHDGRPLATTTLTSPGTALEGTRVEAAAAAANMTGEVGAAVEMEDTRVVEEDTTTAGETETEIAEVETTAGEITTKVADAAEVRPREGGTVRTTADEMITSAEVRLHAVYSRPAHCASLILGRQMTTRADGPGHQAIHAEHHLD